MLICPAGPPKLMNPSFSQYKVISKSDKLAGMVAVCMFESFGIDKAIYTKTV
jgi:hypothetical protein